MNFRPFYAAQEKLTPIRAGVNGANKACGFNPLTMLWSKQISVLVRLHLSTAYSQTFFYVNIHFEGRICKLPFLCASVRSSVNGHKNEGLDLLFF